MMVEREHRQVSPLAPASGYGRSDVEASDSEELRRQKRKKLIIYIVAFVIFQIGVITVFSLTVMKVKTPKFRVRSATFESFEVPNSTADTNPSFNLKMNAQLGVKNSNFGPYKYSNSTIYFFYRGTPIGNAVVPKSKAGLQSTKKFNVMVDLTSGTNLTNNSELANDISSGILPLTSQSRLRGKVTLMLIMKKKKSINMNCTMVVNIQGQNLQDIKCK